MAEEQDLSLNEFDGDEDKVKTTTDNSAAPKAPETVGQAMVEVGDLPRGAAELESVFDIPVKVSAVLGTSTMQVSELLKLGAGAIIELDRKVGEAIDIYVNNRLVARGEVVVVEDHLGITMTEIIKSEKDQG